MILINEKPEHCNKRVIQVRFYFLFIELCAKKLYHLFKEIIRNQIVLICYDNIKFL